VCTLIVGIGIVGPGTLVVGANRDESPGRPASSPGLLRERPVVVGGRDLVAGGTWLAIREGRFVTALLNRRPVSGGPGVTGDPNDPSAYRSRGLLCLDAAAAGPATEAPHRLDPGTGDRHPAHRDAALALLARDSYAHCTLVGLEAGGEAWAIHAGHGKAPETTALPPGWHVITHANPDDPNEPRTAWLLEQLDGMEADGVDAVLEGVAALLACHEEDGNPAVCLHRDRFPTVSSALLALGDVGTPRYLHAAGPPCVTPYTDVSSLLVS
jgi:hypothetical protein